MAAGWFAALLVPGLLFGPPADRAAAVLAYLAAFAAVPLTLALVLRGLHGRGLSGVIGPGGLRGRTLFAAMALVLGLAGLGLLAGDAVPEPRQDWRGWLMLLPLAVPLVAVQSASEELVFRGYLLQGLAARWRAPLVWALGPALLFGVLHWNPAMFGPNAPAVVAVTVLAGLVLADVTARTGNLSAAIGLHAANNLWAFLVLAPPSDLAVLALFTLPVPGPRSAEMGRMILTEGAVILAVWGGWRLWRARLQRAGRDSI